MNEVIFNGLTLNDHMIVKKIQETILPPMVTKRHSVPGLPGAIFQKKELGEREIEVFFEIIACSFSERETAINAIIPSLYTQEEKTLTLRGTRNYKASLDGMTDIKNIVFNGEGSFVFLATDPIAYGEERTVETGNNLTLAVVGTYETKPKLSYTFTGPAAYVKFTNTTTGKYIQVDHSFVSGNILEIDFNGKWKAKKNGVVIDSDITIESDFFPLLIGENKLKSEPLGLNPSLIYSERWL